MPNYKAVGGGDSERPRITSINDDKAVVFIIMMIDIACDQVLKAVDVI